MSEHLQLRHCRHHIAIGIWHATQPQETTP